MTFDLVSVGIPGISGGRSLVDVMCGMAFMHAWTTSYIYSEERELHVHVYSTLEDSVHRYMLQYHSILLSLSF